VTQLLLAPREAGKSTNKGIQGKDERGPFSTICSGIYPEILVQQAAACLAGFLLKENLQMSRAPTPALSAPLLRRRVLQ